MVLTTGPPRSAPATTAAAMSLFRIGVAVLSFGVDMVGREEGVPL